VPNRPETPVLKPTPYHLDAPAARLAVSWHSVPEMRYQLAYLWFLAFSTLDIVLTWIILGLDGTEVNPIARMIIDTWSLPGAIAFKFSLVVFVVIVCEVVGRRIDLKGRWLARIAVAVSAFPVIYSIGLLTYHVMVVVRDSGAG
jgi:hypothetical protein